MSTDFPKASSEIIHLRNLSHVISAPFPSLSFRVTFRSCPRGHLAPCIVCTGRARLGMSHHNSKPLRKDGFLHILTSCSAARSPAETGQVVGAQCVCAGCVDGYPTTGVPHIFKPCSAPGTTKGWEEESPDCANLQVSTYWT